MTKEREKVMDTFEDLSSWKAITSGQAVLRISQDQGFETQAMAVAVGVENFPTYYGKISWSIRLEEPDTLLLTLKGDPIVPAGAIIVKPALPRPIHKLEVNGRSSMNFDADGFLCRKCPPETVARL